MAFLLLLGTVFVTACSAATVPSEIPIDATAVCGTTNAVAKEGEYILLGTGDSPAADCSFAFTADSVSDCSPALCYMFDIYAFFKDPKASLELQSGTEFMTYTNVSKTPRGPVCTMHEKLTVIMREEAGYTFDPNKPKEAYKFRLSIYNKCGAKGSAKGIKFEDAIQHADGNRNMYFFDKLESTEFLKIY